MPKNLPKIKLTPQAQFEANIRKRLQKDIGKLIPDEILVSMIQTTIKKLFNEKVVTKDQWGNVLDSQESWFEKEIWSLVKPRIKEQLQIWCKNNEEKISELAIDFFEAGMPAMIGTTIAGLLANASASMEINISTAIEDRIRQRTAGF